MRKRRSFTIANRGIVEWHEPTAGPYPYHVTIRTFAGVQYLGAVATLREGKRAILENT
jgi:hypothetical protein